MSFATTLWRKHWMLERNSILLLIGILIVIAIGGLVEVVPLFYLKSTIETAPGMRPYTPLELAGRDIYVREGCYLCHSQMIRPFRDEKLRYGHYSLAAESQYDHPFQWGSKRTGPDLARVGGKYSNEWHVQHLNNPRSVVPVSVMPSYPWLATTPLDISDLEQRLKALRTVGVPYSLTQAEYDANVKKFGPQGAVMLHIPDAQRNLIEQANLGNYDGNKAGVSELDALIAYLQVLGTMVDFSKVNEDELIRSR